MSSDKQKTYKIKPETVKKYQKLYGNQIAKLYKGGYTPHVIASRLRLNPRIVSHMINQDWKQSDVRPKEPEQEKEVKRMIEPWNAEDKIKGGKKMEIDLDKIRNLIRDEVGAITEKDKHEEFVTSIEKNLASLNDSLSSIRNDLTQKASAADLSKISQDVDTRIQSLPTFDELLSKTCNDPNSPLCKLMSTTIETAISKTKESILEDITKKSKIIEPKPAEDVVPPKPKIDKELEKQIMYNGVKHAATCPECTKKLVSEIWTLEDKKNVAIALCQDAECRKAINSAFTDDELKAIIAERGLKFSQEVDLSKVF